MRQNKATILSTRPLPAALIKEAARQGIAIDVEPFIETEAIQSVEVQQEIEQALLQTATVVFTSSNAVEAVAVFLQEEMPAWTVYCMENATERLVKKYLGEQTIAGTAGDASALAELIAAEADTDEVIFFCGDQRRDELPAILNSQGIEVTEIMVYQTIATPHVIRKRYNGILFFSPSAVNSFFLKNKVSSPVMLFAIGNTTAAAIAKHTTAGIITSDKPGKENLLNKAINYFVNNER